MEHCTDKARVLIEALPYLRQFRGETVVIKYGGHAMTDETLKKAFALNVILLKYVGVNPVIVHGGGPQIGRLLDKLGITYQFREGYRVTDEAVMDVVEMVLVGQVNQQIVNQINLHGGRAVGLSGKDGWLIRAQQMEMAVNRDDAPPEIIDLGRVGEVTHIDVGVIRSLESQGFIPIIAPVGVGPSGGTYNINADAVAAAVAAALKAKKLILLTDVAGLLDASGGLVSSLTRKDAAMAIENKVATGGMIPKLKCCIEAVDAGVEKACIIDGRKENCILLELFTDHGIGTEVTR